MGEILLIRLWMLMHLAKDMTHNEIRRDVSTNFSAIFRNAIIHAGQQKIIS